MAYIARAYIARCACTIGLFILLVPLGLNRFRTVLTGLAMTSFVWNWILLLCTFNKELTI